VSLISKINEVKNTEQMDCPHCAVMALFNFSSPKETRNIEIRDAFCQGCGKVIVQIRKVNCELIPRGPLGGLTNSKSACTISFMEANDFALLLAPLF
jgi:MinD superfamily P-loop ATPase